MDQKTRLTVVASEWSEDAAAMLSVAAGCATMADLQHQVEQHGAQLFAVLDDSGDTVGRYVLRIDRDSQGCEGVLVAAAGRADGVDLTTAIIPVAIRQCVGCYSFRVHTHRPGLVKKLDAMGFGGAEVVMRKKI